MQNLRNMLTKQQGVLSINHFRKIEPRNSVGERKNAYGVSTLNDLIGVVFLGFWPKGCSNGISSVELAGRVSLHTDACREAQKLYNETFGSL